MSEPELADRPEDAPSALAALPTPKSAPVPPAVRAQILATEHWSLLATRSMTWSEVMSRITIHLTVTSASLVVLALVAQATGFGPGFQVMAIGLATSAFVLGTLTSMRVMNASNDDAAMVVGMNRLRAAYVDIDPGIEPYLVTSIHDDQRGLSLTYSMGWPRSTVSHVMASTSFFMIVFNSMVAGTLVALVASAADATTGLVALLGAAAGLVNLVIHMAIGHRMFAQIHPNSRFPSPPPA